MVGAGVELLGILNESDLQNHLPKWEDLHWERLDRNAYLFCSVNSKLVEQDFTDEQQRDFSVRKEILMESEDAGEINGRESKFILEYQSNNPAIGYNQWPKFRG